MPHSACTCPGVTYTPCGILYTTTLLSSPACHPQVAHDLSAVMSYDRVAVMEEGTVVEVGQPQQLLKNSGGRLAALAAASRAGAMH